LIYILHTSLINIDKYHKVSDTNTCQTHIRDTNRSLAHHCQVLLALDSL